MKRLGRPIRLAVLALATYVVAVVAAQVVTLAAVMSARLTTDGSVTGQTLGIHNFRMVDDRLWAGAQPDREGYRELARRGVSTVVDLRTGADDDPREDQPSFLSSLGVEYRPLPVRDGHAPSPEDVRRFLDAVEKAPGVVFVHCGAGVGRTSTVQAAYLAAGGQEPSVWRLVAVGPLTLEQAWVVSTATANKPGQPNPVVRRVSELLDAPRRGLSRIRALL